MPPKVIPLRKCVGRLLGPEPKDEAEHFIRCPTCGGWVDWRDLGAVFADEGPLRHPADQSQ